MCVVIYCRHVSRQTLTNQIDISNNNTKKKCEHSLIYADPWFITKCLNYSDKCL